MHPPERPCRPVRGRGRDETDDEHDGDAQDQLAFDDTPEGDRLHRYQAHWTRSLLRTLEAITRLRSRGDGGGPDDEGEPDEPPIQVSPLIDPAPTKPDSTRGAMHGRERFGSRANRTRFDGQGHATGRQDWNLAPRRGERNAIRWPRPCNRKARLESCPTKGKATSIRWPRPCRQEGKIGILPHEGQTELRSTPSDSERAPGPGSGAFLRSATATPAAIDIRDDLAGIGGWLAA